MVCLTGTIGGDWKLGHHKNIPNNGISNTEMKLLLRKIESIIIRHKNAIYLTHF